jgi:hypothetical protein
MGIRPIMSLSAEQTFEASEKLIEGNENRPENLPGLGFRLHCPSKSLRLGQKLEAESEFFW